MPDEQSKELYVQPKSHQHKSGVNWNMWAVVAPILLATVTPPSPWKSSNSFESAVEAKISDLKSTMKSDISDLKSAMESRMARPQCRRGHGRAQLEHRT